VVQLDTAATLLMAGRISGVGGVRVTGNGTVRLEGANSFTGPTVISGRLAMSGDTVLGNGGKVHFLRGTTASVSVTLSRDWDSSREIELAAFTTVNTAGFNAVWNGPLTAEPANTNLTKSGRGVLTINSLFDGLLPVSVTGTSSVLRLGGNAGVLSPRALGGGKIVLDNSTLRSDRIWDSSSVTLTDGELELIGNATTPTVEYFSTLTLADSTANYVTVQTPANFPALLHANQVSFGSGYTTFRGTRLAENGNGGLGRIAFDLPPLLQDGLLPHAIADPEISGRDGFATYDSRVDAAGQIGVRPLLPTEYVSGGEIRNPSHGGAVPMNANYLAAGATDVAGSQAILHTLTFADGALTMSSDQLLEISSGAILVPRDKEGAIVGGTLVIPTATLAFAGGGDLRVASTIAFPNIKTERPTLLKLGPGRTTLADITTFSDSTPNVAIEDGVLVVNQNDAELGDVSVRTRAVLEGNGKIGGTTTVAGKLAPGDSVGTLFLAGLTFQEGATLALEIDSRNVFDQVNVIGSVSLTADVNLALTIAPDFDAGTFATFPIILNDATDMAGRTAGASFTFGSVRLSEGASFQVGANSFKLSYVGGDGNDIVLSVVPEPSALVLSAGSVFLLSGRRRTMPMRK
jgi:autotransporter-associated beta strand protein